MRPGVNPEPNSAKPPQVPLWYWWLAIPVMFLLLQSLFESRNTQALAYSEFKQMLHAGKVAEAALSEDTIRGTLKPEAAGAAASASASGAAARRAFVTVRVADTALVQELEAAGVHFEGKARNDWLALLLSWAIPIGVIMLLWGYLARRSGLSSSFALDPGKSHARVYVESQTGVRFDDVAGIDEAKDELMEVVDFLRQPERYRRLGGKIPKGVLIVGAPGTGKTLLAKAVAGEAKVPFFSISGSEFVEMFVGVGAARVRDLFAQAEQKAPCIIFIDELDALGRARGSNAIFGGHSEQEQTLNQLLVEMDGFNTNKGVIILAATNRPEVLDAALLRPGRFDRQIAIDRPDLHGREKILQVHARQVSLAPGVELALIAARTAGFAGADLANLVNEAALLAARRDKNAVDMAEFDEAIERIVAGLEKKTRVMNPQEKETVAYHEAGHAVVAECRAHADRVGKISIIPRGVAALGYTQQLPTEDRYLLKKAELLDRLDVLLGGRVAEELVFGDVSTGAQNDLQTATDMARHMVTQYGMSERLGLATFEAVRAPFLGPAALPERQSYSEHTAQTIDGEIAKLLDDAHGRVRKTLQDRRALLNALAHLLLERETVDQSTLGALLAQYP